MRRRLLALPAAATALACVRPPHTAPAPLLSISRDSLELLTAISALQWNAALSTGDTTLLARTLAPDAMLTRPNGTTIRGAPVIARDVLTHWGAAGAYLTTMLPATTVRCVVGATQTGAYTVEQVVSPSRAVEVESGSYGIRWREGDATLVADRVAFDTRRSETGMERAAGCESPGHARFARSFLEIGAMPIAVGSRWTAIDALERDLTRAGWSRAAARIIDQVPGPTLTSFSHDKQGRSTSADDGLVIATVRIGSLLALEGTTQLGDGRGALLTYNEAQQSRLYQEFAAREQSVLALVLWRGFRVGAGPARVRVAWREKYQQVYFDPQRGYLPAPALITDSAWTRRISAEVLQAGYVYPFGRWAYCQALIRYRYGASVTLPGVRTHEHWSADMNGLAAGVGFGLAW